MWNWLSCFIFHRGSCFLLFYNLCSNRFYGSDDGIQKAGTQHYGTQGQRLYDGYAGIKPEENLSWIGSVRNWGNIFHPIQNDWNWLKGIRLTNWQWQHNIIWWLRHCLHATTAFRKEPTMSATNDNVLFFKDKVEEIMLKVEKDLKTMTNSTEDDE